MSDKNFNVSDSEVYNNVELSLCLITDDDTTESIDKKINTFIENDLQNNKHTCVLLFSKNEKIHFLVNMYNGVRIIDEDTNSGKARKYIFSLKNNQELTLTNLITD